MPAYLDLQPVQRLKGRVRLPPSKSLANRALLLAALAEGSTRFEPPGQAEDIQIMLSALAKLGVSQHRLPEGLSVQGVQGIFPRQIADLDVGNAGTVMRFLTAALAMQSGQYRLRGVARMQHRPIGDLVIALQTLGASIACLGAEGYPPLQINPHTEVSLPERLTIRGDTSSQFLSALLMALPLRLAHADAGVLVQVSGGLISAPYVAMTVALMRQFKVEVEQREATAFYLSPRQHYISPGKICLEGDASNASYFAVAAALGGGPVVIAGISPNSLQGDVKLLDLLHLWGVQVTWGDHQVTVQAKIGWRPPCFDLDLVELPDAAMTLAVLALFAPGPCVLRNIGSWRFKETDRILAMAQELAKVGAQVKTTEDSIQIVPPLQWRSAVIETYDDHRMAMCFSLLTLGGVAVRILNPDCANKTFPGYFDVFSTLKS